MTAIIDVLWLAGTFNPNGEGISDDFLKHLDPKRFRYRYVPFPADYGREVSYGESVKAGERALLNAITACPGAVVIGGYSQGATIAGNVAAGIHPRSAKVIGCALIADPLRDGLQTTINPNPGGYGIGGNRWIDPKRFPVWQFSAPGDPISELPVGNPLRTFADLTEFWGPDQGRWMQELADRARKRQWQRWWDLSNWQSWGGAIYWAQNYLFRQRHIRYSVENMVGENVTYTARLAKMIGGLS